MLRVYVYRPDKALYENETIKNENLYGPDGKAIPAKKTQEQKHPMEVIHKNKIGSSYIEVER